MIGGISNHYSSGAKFIIYVLFLCFITGNKIYSHSGGDTLSTNTLKQLTLEELMNIDITIVSKQSQPWFEAPASVYIISNDDIKRSGAKSIPEALRLAPNLMVAKVNASQWAISARGFNNVLANKLLVMIDGRSVYTPLYAGVYWDVNDVLLEDIDRIEVISGPGGNLWGANAVNGIINIITKKAKDSKGLFIDGGAGTELKRFANIRYGGSLSSDLQYRIYAKAFDYGSTLLYDGSDANDVLINTQGGFRLDWDQNENNTLNLESDYYNGNSNPDGNSPTFFEGGNVLGRWKHTISETSDLQFQSYYDRTWRDFGNGLKEGLSTLDFDWQHSFKFDKRQGIVWGLGFRLMDHKIDNLPLFGFIPPHKTLHLYSAFIQDEIVLIENSLNLSVGSKVEHNDFTGFEFQPSVRLTWTATIDQTLWAAVSRVVRTPSRLERDFVSSLAPGIPFLVGNHDFESETLIAYELGWRLQPSGNFSFSLATFYNDYDNLRSAEPGGPPPFYIPIIISNGVEGKSFGVEISSLYRVADWWLVHWGYTFLRKDLSIKPYSHDLNNGTAESDDPENQLLVQSSMDLFNNFQLNIFIRYTDDLENKYVPGYVSMDAKVGWKPTEFLEFDIVGQNLLHERHPEFIPSSPSPRQIERSIYGEVSLRL